MDDGVDARLAKASGMKQVGHGSVLGEVHACIGDPGRRAGQKAIEAARRRTRAEGEDPLDPLVVKQRFDDPAAEGLVRMGDEHGRH